jgi:hypothetical protein
MTRNGFLYTGLILALLGWGVWKRANDNAYKHPQEFGTERASPSAPLEPRIVAVTNRSANKTYRIDLNRMPACDGLEPIPLPDGTDPYLERIRKSFGPKLAFPQWLVAPPGTKILSEVPSGEMILGPDRASNSVMRTEETAETAVDLDKHYQEVCRKAGMKPKSASWFGHAILERGFEAQSEDGNAVVRVSGHNSGGKTTALVSYELKRRGVFHYDPVAAYPVLELDRFDEEEQALYLVDLSSGQRFRLTEDVLETEDESAYGNVEIEKAQFPDWLKRYPGMTVQHSHGAVIINGVRNEGHPQETAVTSDEFDKVVAFYQKLFRQERVTFEGEQSG